MKREITYYMRPWYPVTIIEDTEEGGATRSPFRIVRAV